MNSSRNFYNLEGNEFFASSTDVFVAMDMFEVKIMDYSFLWISRIRLLPLTLFSINVGLAAR